MQNKGNYAVKCYLRSFNVIEVGIYRKPVCDFLLVITDILSHTVSELLQLIIQMLDTLRFEPPPFRGLGTPYDVHLGLIGKCVVDFLIVLTELFSLGFTAEALRTIFVPTDSPYDFLLVYNTNLPHILHRFLVLLQKKTEKPRSRKLSSNL